MTKCSIRHEENFAYDKPFSNNLVVSKTYKGHNMDNENDSLEMEQNGMTVTLLFPKTSKKETSVGNDIKMILSNILREYLQRNDKIKGGNAHEPN